jgi:hypothetical protein
MSLAEKAKQGPPHKRRGGCSIGELLGVLPDPEADALRAMLGDPAWTHAAISRALKDEGANIEGQTVSRHREQRCRCS